MPIILDRWGQPLTISPQRTDIDLDAEAALELRAEEAARRRATTEIVDNVAAEETVSPTEHSRACAAARMVAYSEAYAESFAIGKKAGAAAVDKHFMAIIRACERDDAKLLAAINLTLEFPEITATAIIDMAGKHFTNLRRGSAALALRDTLPNSLQRAVAQLAEEGA